MLKASVRCARHGTSEQRSQSLHRCHNRQSKHVLRRKLEPLRAFFVRGLCCNPCDPGRHKTGGPRPSPRLRPQAEAPFPGRARGRGCLERHFGPGLSGSKGGPSEPFEAVSPPGPTASWAWASTVAALAALAALAWTHLRRSAAQSRRAAQTLTAPSFVYKASLRRRHPRGDEPIRRALILSMKGLRRS